MNIGEAIEAAKGGANISRSGWNGKGMYVYYHAEMTERVAEGEVIRKREPYLVMHTAQGTEQAGWLANQADLLADDWIASCTDCDGTGKTEDDGPCPECAGKGNL